MMMMDSSLNIKNREKIAKEIARTSNSIRKKYRALKTGRMEEDGALERHFKPIVQPLKQIAESATNVESNVNVKTESPSVSTNVEAKSVISKPEEKTHMLKNRKLLDMSWDYTDTIPLLSPKRKRLDDSPMSFTLREAPLSEQPHESSPNNTLPIDENTVFETPDEPLATSVRRELQTTAGQQTLRDHFGPLGQQYFGMLLSGEKNTVVDNVYGVRLNNDGAMLGDKRIDVDRSDNIIIDGTRYKGTPGLYELIFKRLPDDTVYTEVDKHKYKSILLATNAHRRGCNPLNPILGNRGYKYKNIIAPLVSHVSSNKTAVGKGFLISRDVMTLNDNKIDYTYWDDPNELVDRLRLLEASRKAGNNAHDNEILSIIEELREAGLIIN